MVRAVATLLLVPLLLPGALAERVSGDLVLGAGLVLEGDAAIATSQGSLDLAGAIVAGRPLSLRFASAEGYVVTREWEHRGVEGVLEPAPSIGTPRNDSLSLEAGALDDVTCGAQCRVLLLAADADASLGISGHASGPVGVTVAERVYASGAADGPARDSFYHRVPPGWVVASPAPIAHLPTLLLGEGTARATGNLTLFLADASATWRGEEGERRLSAEPTSRPLDGPGGVPLGRRVETRFIVLRLVDAQLDAQAGAELVLAAPSPSLELAGALRADSARGVLHVGERRFDVRDERLEMEGRLEARALPQTPAVGALSAPTRVPVRAPLEGDASRLVLAGRPVALAQPMDLSAAAVVTGLSLAGLLAALLVLKLVGVPFYMRLTHASLLRNENRRRIYDAIRGRPGVTVAELVRETALAEIVVRHHARMLEAHRYVAVKASGKVRALFALDGEADPEAMALHVVLKDATRRRLAALLANAPLPRTQGDLAAEAGLSRRLVSHHLARLERSGLVESTGSTPRGYRPTPRLVAFLAAPETG